MAKAPFPETHNINQYRQKCDYKISKFHTKIDKTEFKLPDDPESKAVCETLMEKEGDAHIRVKFDDNSLYENKRKVSFQGPSLCSTCTISGIKKTFYREFGYIQTSKRFYENEFENAIVYSDFHVNLLHEQDEVLDSDSESSPFYSTESCTKVLANEDLAHTIKLHFSDCPSCDIPKINGCKSSKTLPKHDWGYLQKHERYQQFFVYVVMRSKKNSEEWKYDVLFSFDWFIYLKWIKVTGENNNIFEYNCGINVRINPVRNLPKLMEYYTCNDDELEYWIDKIDCKFNIDNIPKSISKNELESITSNVSKLCGYVEITDLNTANLEGIDSFRSKGDKLCKDAERINSEINAFFKDYRSMALEVKKFNKDIENIDCEEIIYRKTHRDISAKVKKLNGSIQRLDPIERKDYADIDSLLPEVNRLCENVTKMDLNKRKTFENYSDVKKLYGDRENVDSENIDRHNSNIVGKVNDLYVCITGMNQIERKIYEDIERLLPKLKRLTKKIENIYLEKNDFSENLRCISFEVNKLCECIEMMDLDKKEFRDNYTTVAWKISKLLTSTEKNDLNEIKEFIERLNPKVKKLCKDENINFEKSKFCKCKYLDETDLCEIIKNKLFERNNKENFGQVEKVGQVEQKGQVEQIFLLFAVSDLLIFDCSATDRREQEKIERTG